MSHFIFQGSGTATLVFKNCWNNGMVTTYLEVFNPIPSTSNTKDNNNDLLLARAGSSQVREVTFSFNHLDKLRIQEDSAIIQLISLTVDVCRSGIMNNTSTTTSSSTTSTSSSYLTLDKSNVFQESWVKLEKKDDKAVPPTILLTSVTACCCLFCEIVKFWISRPIPKACIRSHFLSIFS